MAESQPIPAETLALFEKVQFADRSRAEDNLARIQGRVPPGLLAIVPPLIADLPDADAALNLFERLTETAGPELIQLLDRHHNLAHYALTVFGYSQYLGETLLQNTDLLQTLLREENLDRSHSHEEFREAFARFRSRSFTTDVALLLARFKRREYIRLMLRDVLGFARLAETTAEISALSDVLIEEALRHCESELQRRYGQPQHRDKEDRLVPTAFSVLALGKLGGKELNYSSDVDLFYVYEDGETDDNAPITNAEYFVRLGQNITNVLSRVTAEGFVFRIDLRLRPQGREGETAISLDHALHYYSETARDWERQAMIKARPAAGDVKLARKFVRGLQEHVYTENVNFAAIETALETLDRMRVKRVATEDGAIDVKLDRGGIRDIEFLVQCLQRVYGGKQRWLRSGGTLFSLQKLHDKRHISGSDFHHLTTVYEFLRCIEHRLQLRRGQQTHRLPNDEHELNVLARSLDHSGATSYRGAELGGVVREQMAVVREIYDRIIHQQQQRSEQQVQGDSDPRTAAVEFGRMPSDQQVLQRLSADNPALYQIASRKDLEPHTRRNLFRFLSSSFTSAERYEAVATNSEAVERAIELFRSSELLTDILVRHPEDVASLRGLRATTSGDEGQFAIAALGWSDAMAALRRRFRHRTFLSGARDVLEARPVGASLAEMTSTAEEAIRAAAGMAGSPAGMAILAVGRLGTSEFDCLSDADLLFVRDKRLSGKTATRAAEDVVNILSAYTNEGSVMVVDVRLRPHGGEGEIVVTPDQLETYLRSEAAAWEALTHTKLRYIAGSKSVAQKAISATQSSRTQFAESSSFAAEVREMRRKLEKSETGLKTNPGGSYDIDFLVSYAIVKYGINTAEGTTADRLRTVGLAGVIEKAELQVLLDAWEFYRTVEHAIRLVTGRTGKMLPVSEIARASVTDLTSRMLTREFRDSLEEDLFRLQEKVRSVFDRFVQ